MLLWSSPIPLEDHVFRSFEKDSLWNYALLDSSDFWRNHNVTFLFSNRFYLSNDSTLQDNRAFFLLDDSLDFEKLSFNMRIRVDQIGHDAVDAGWVDPDEDIIYDLDRSIMYWTPSDQFRFGFGKERLNWGPLELGGLLLSDYNQGFTMFYQEYHLGSFCLKGVSTQLNSTPWGKEVNYEQSTIEKRYFSASRLEYYRETFGFAVGQSLIYGGESRTFEIPYLLPFFPYHYGQMANWREGNLGENTFGAFDGYYRLFEKRVEFYGEVLVDDAQGDSDSISQSVQNNIGWMIGSRLTFDNWSLFLEGGEISSFVYNHVAGEKLRYQHEKGMIGSPLGPDQQLLWGTLEKKFQSNFLAKLTGWYRRSGERDISLEYTLKNTIFGSKDDAIPYGIVEEELSYWTTLEYHRFHSLFELVGGVTHYKNRGHHKSSWRYEPFIGFSIKTGIILK